LTAKPLGTTYTLKAEQAVEGQHQNDLESSLGALADPGELFAQLLSAQGDLGEGVAISEDLRPVYVNEGLARMYGYTREELLALPSLLDLVVPEERTRLVESLMRRMAGENVAEFGEATAICKDGRRIVNEYALKPLRVGGKTLILSIARDITERKRAEESIRQLSRRLLRAQDDEQERISRELRTRIADTMEDVLSMLTTVRDSETVFDWRTQDALRRGITLTMNVIREIQSVSRLLYPPLLDEAGLSEAIRWYIFDYTRHTKVKVALDVPLKLGRLSRKAEQVLFRVIQESLANVARHSGSPSASIQLRRERNSIHLEVRDSGKGIPPGILEENTGTVAISGVGIRAMAERMRELGGRLSVTSTGAGTTVTATLPASVAQSDSAA
jgi:PAS domain S-box-containing protein